MSHRMFHSVIAKIKSALPPIPVAVSMLTVVIVFSWFVTEGSWQFTASLQPGFRQFYDAQAASLLQGRLDVPPETIGYEAFVYQGKTFGYFGIGPSLLRIPLNFLFPSLWGRWNALFLLAGCITNLLAIYWLYREISRWAGADSSHFNGTQRLDGWFSFLILVFGLGSTNLFLSSHASIYHEPIILGGAFCLSSILAYLKFIRSPSPGPFIGMVLFGFLTFFTRITFGASVLILIGALLVILCIQKWLPSFAKKLKRRMRGASTPRGEQGSENLAVPGGQMLALDERSLAGYISALLLFFIFVIGLYAWVNQTKFGTWMDDHSYKNYPAVSSSSERYQRTQGGKTFFIQNFPMMSSFYFFPLDSQTTKDFPPFLSNRINQARFPEAHWDWLEATIPVPFSMPFELILACVGLFSLFKVKQSRFMLLLVLVTALNVLLMLFFNSISQRYEHEFFPFLVLSGTLGFIHLTGKMAALKKPFKTALLAAFLVLGLISIYQSFAITFNDQRTGSFLVTPARRAELQKISSDANQELIVIWRSAKELLQPLRSH